MESGQKRTMASHDKSEPSPKRQEIEALPTESVCDPLLESDVEPFGVLRDDKEGEYFGLLSQYNAEGKNWYSTAEGRKWMEDKLGIILEDGIIERIKNGENLVDVIPTINNLMGCPMEKGEEVGYQDLTMKERFDSRAHYSFKTQEEFKGADDEEEPDATLPFGYFWMEDQNGKQLKVHGSSVTVYYQRPVVKYGDVNVFKSKPFIGMYGIRGEFIHENHEEYDEKVEQGEIAFEHVDTESAKYFVRFLPSDIKKMTA